MEWLTEKYVEISTNKQFLNLYTEFWKKVHENKYFSSLKFILEILNIDHQRINIDIRLTSFVDLIYTLKAGLKLEELEYG